MGILNKISDFFGGSSMGRELITEGVAEAGVEIGKYFFKEHGKETIDRQIENSKKRARYRSRVHRAAAQMNSVSRTVLLETIAGASEAESDRIELALANVLEDIEHSYDPGTTNRTLFELQVEELESICETKESLNLSVKMLTESPGKTAMQTLKRFAAQANSSEALRKFDERLVQQRKKAKKTRPR